MRDVADQYTLQTSSAISLFEQISVELCGRDIQLLWCNWMCFQNKKPVLHLAGECLNCVTSYSIYCGIATFNTHIAGRWTNNILSGGRQKEARMCSVQSVCCIYMLMLTSLPLAIVGTHYGWWAASIVPLSVTSPPQFTNYCCFITLSLHS